MIVEICYHLETPAEYWWVPLRFYGVWQRGRREMERPIDSDWTTSLYVGGDAKDSASAMSRLSSRMGLHKTTGSAGSAYIILSKIRKVLQEAAEHASVKTRVTYDRLCSKLEKLSLTELQYIQSILLEDTFEDMVARLRTKATLIRKEASRWKRSLDDPYEEPLESDDPTEIVMKLSEDIGTDLPED